MKTFKHFFSWTAGAVCYIAMTLVLMGYGNKEMHPAINKPIVDAFLKHFVNTLNPPAELTRYTFVLDGSHTYTGPGITQSGLFATTTFATDQAKTPKEWIARGGFSADVPEVPAALRHFYDPLGIDGGKTYLSNRGTNWEWIINNNQLNPHINAKDWALTHADNEWTFAKGKEWVRKALAEADETKRDGYMARAWRCLGETLHLIADMGCPVHVRNDSHAAPLPWSYRRALGDPDPYEELVKPAYAATYANGAVDPTLQSSCRTAKTADKIFDVMAEFTNSNFFTNQTISGTGVKQYDPIITGRPAYPSPKLEHLDYDPVDFTFYKNFPGGQRVKMCKDDAYFYFRGYPYIDEECVESQATALMPNIMEAGANIMRLFIPRLTVTLSEAKIDGTVKGTVTHVATDEYLVSVSCKGTVRILVKNKIVGEGTLAADGSFEFNGVNLAKDDNVVAEYSFGGVSVQSAAIKAGDAGILDQLHACKTVRVLFYSDNRYSDGLVREDFHGFGWDYIPDGIGLQPIAWSGTSFSFQHEFTSPDWDGKWSITGTMSDDGRTLKSLRAVEDDKQRDAVKAKELRIVNLLLDPAYNIVPKGAFNYGHYDIDPVQHIEYFSYRYSNTDAYGNPYSYEFTEILSNKVDLYVCFYK